MGNTRGILKQLESTATVEAIYKRQNAGKGAALRDGFTQAIGDIVVVQDADVEYDPQDITRLIEPILRDEADVVYGSRFLSKPQTSRLHRFGNWALTLASNWTTGLKLTDMETCYKAFRRDVLASLSLQQNRFGFEPEVTAKIARRGYRVVEVPISYRPRSYAEGKKIGIRDLLSTLWCIVRYGFRD